MKLVNGRMIKADGTKQPRRVVVEVDYNWDVFNINCGGVELQMRFSTIADVIAEEYEKVNRERGAVE